MNFKRLIIRSTFIKVIVKLGLTDILMNFYWRKRSAKKWDTIALDGKMSAPASVWYEPTMRCNLRCKFCHQTERRQHKLSEMTTAEVLSFFENVKAHNIQRIDMIGGEIFVRKDIFELLDWIEENGLKVKLGSNGVMINEERIARLKEYTCIESIAISLDGKQETHDWLRGQKGAYEKSTTAIKKMAGSNFMLISYGVLVPENFDSIEFLIANSKEIGLDRMSFIPEISYSKKDIDRSYKMLGIDTSSPIYVEPKEIEDQQAYYETMNKSIEEIKKQRKKHGTFSPIYPHYAQKHPETFFLNKSRHKKLGCNHLNILTIKENGDVIVCPYIHIKTGNIKENTIEEIWNNETFCSARKKILSKNLLPICARCCAIEECG